MDVHLRQFFYLNTLTNSGSTFALPVSTSTSSAGRAARIGIENLDATSGLLSPGTTIRSGNLVVLTASDGAFLSFEGGGANRLLTEPSVTTPRVARETFRVWKIDALDGSRIASGDLVRFSVAESTFPGVDHVAPIRRWMSAPGSGGPVTFVTLRVPLANEAFQLLVPPKIADFTFPDELVVPYQEMSFGIGQVSLGSPALFGGTPFIVLHRPPGHPVFVSALEDFVAEGQTVKEISYPLHPTLGHDLPDDSTRELMALLVWNQETIQRSVRLRYERNPFLEVRVDAQRYFPALGCFPPGISWLLPWRARYEVEASLHLHPHPSVSAEHVPIQVTLSLLRAAPGAISQESHELSERQPIRFTMRLNAQVTERLDTLTASFSMGDARHRPAWSVSARDQTVTID